MAYIFFNKSRQYLRVILHTFLYFRYVWLSVCICIPYLRNISLPKWFLESTKVNVPISSITKKSIFLILCFRLYFLLSYIVGQLKNYVY